MQATLDMTAQMYVSHPGEVQPYGNGRPNYWAGNGTLPLAAQYRNLGIMMYRLDPEHPVDFYPCLRAADGIFFLYRRGVHGGDPQGGRLCGRPGGQRTENGGERAVPVPGV